ncbi:MAG: hypothetical protein DWQ07_08740 [Chloroflexi bacterium]|nr:MAG: hypothetical protein DWQ07_08740 [Chloroflexota bacterium]MBL1193202.1 hypothetical protein [Chloroflexota bacterium]NOH10496.1 hypothetical protein [Chloroflexota bacterium]
MTDTRRVWFLRGFTLFTLILTLGALQQFAQQAAEELELVTRTRTLALYGGYGFATVLGLILITTWTPLKTRLLHWLDTAFDWLQRLNWVLALIALALVVLFGYLSRGYYGRYLAPPLPRYLAFWLVVVGLAILLLAWLRWRSWAFSLAAAAVVVGFAYYLSGFIGAVNSYPLALGWSETSRYYFGSTYLSELIYGIKTPLPLRDPSRYLMQAVPFLIPNLPLWTHRLWQVLLDAGLTVLASYLLVRRLAVKRRSVFAIVVLWTSLFIFQGPVFKQMVLILVFMFWGFDSQRLRRSTILVVLVSIWAGITRLNWIPMPAMLAAAMYLLEQPMNDTGLWRYVAPIAIWGLLGGAVGYAVQTGYQLLSGNDLGAFNSNFTADLLWYRLLPNLTYTRDLWWRLLFPNSPNGPGILISLAFATLPVLVFIIWAIARQWHNWAFIRLLGLGTMTLLLFVGGLAVSVKIGGGTNLHNVDAFIVFVLLIGSYIYFGKFRPDTSLEAQDLQFQPHWALSTWIILAPVLYALSQGGAFERPNYLAADETIEALTEYMELAEAEGKEVLFISQRHLVTFNTLGEVPLVHDYEKLYLMEMVMANYQPYLEVLYDDLREQRYAAIITDPLFERIKDPLKESGAEENNLYIKRVTRPMLCYYERDATFSETIVQVLVPLNEPDCQP